MMSTYYWSVGLFKYNFRLKCVNVFNVKLFDTIQIVKDFVPNYETIKYHKVCLPILLYDISVRYHELWLPTTQYWISTTRVVHVGIEMWLSIIHLWISTNNKTRVLDEQLELRIIHYLYPLRTFSAPCMATVAPFACYLFLSISIMFISYSFTSSHWSRLSP